MANDKLRKDKDVAWKLHFSRFQDKRPEGLPEADGHA